MADPTVVSFRVRDEDDRTATINHYIVSTESFANVQAYATAMSLLIDALLGARVEKISTTFAGNLNVGVKGVPAAGVPLMQTGLLTFNLTNSARAWSFPLPGILDEYLVGPDGLDAGNVDFDAIKAAMENGVDIGGGTFVTPRNPYNLDVGSFRSGKRADRSY